MNLGRKRRLLLRAGITHLPRASVRQAPRGICTRARGPAATMRSPRITTIASRTGGAHAMRGHFFSTAVVLYDRSERLCGFEQTEPKGNRLGAGRFTGQDRSAHSTLIFSLFWTGQWALDWRIRKPRWGNAATTGTLS